MSVFKTPYQEFIYKRSYSRWNDELGRRETWPETVGRFADYMIERVPNGKPREIFEDVIDAIYRLEVMPSMRALWTAGPALDVDNICAYNCAYTTIEKPTDFAEILYILMNGTGVGFSVERQYINKLPEVPDKFLAARDIIVGDSKLGWAKAFKHLLTYLYDGLIPRIDYSEIRPKGARLKTFGGRASGPEPLKDLFKFTIDTFKKASGRKLNSLEVYDIVTKTAEVVIVGGVRRSATLNLSNLSDRRMARAKDGEFWIHHPNRTLANNSVAYTEKPDIQAFMEEWLGLMKSGTGERGIVNRVGLKKQAEKWGRDPNYDFGVNPCGEVILRPKGLCNLTEIVIRPQDTLEDLLVKARYATILGVLQSTLTDFKFIGPEWKKNAEEERLLGVSLTGLKDHYTLGRISNKAREWLETMHREVQGTAYEWADLLGINHPAAMTSVKPSGTVSQLVDTSSGIHPRYAKYYIRRVRVAANDPVAQLLKTYGVPNSPEVGQSADNANTWVFEFPVKAPSSSIVRGDETAIEQLEYWKMIKECWTEHNPSQTIYVKDHEWLEVGAWVYKNFDIVTGLSFLPYDGGVYQLAPYEEITKEKYHELMTAMPPIDWNNLVHFEKSDLTQGSREYACTGGSCAI